MKTERINIRLTPEEKELIENAAALDGVSVAAFVRQAVLHRIRWRGLDSYTYSCGAEHPMPRLDPEPDDRGE